MGGGGGGGENDAKKVFGGRRRKERSMGLREREKENKCLPVNYRKKDGFTTRFRKGGNRTCAKEEKSCGKKRKDAFYGLNRRFSSPFPPFFLTQAARTHPQSLFPPSVLFGGAAADSNASSSSSSSFLSRLSERAGFKPFRTSQSECVLFCVQVE